MIATSDSRRSMDVPKRKTAPSEASRLPDVGRVDEGVERPDQGAVSTNELPAPGADNLVPDVLPSGIELITAQR